MISFFNKLTSFFQHNITREEQTALKEIRNWDKQTIRIQDKGSIFVTFDNSRLRGKSTTSNKKKFISKNFRKPDKIYEKNIYLDRKMVRQKKHWQKIKEICNSERCNTWEDLC